MKRQFTLAVAVLAVAAMLAACSRSGGNMEGQNAAAEAVDRELGQMSSYESEGRDYMAQQLKQDTALRQTGSGLVYKIINPGSGSRFKAADVVNVVYVGSHISGEIFDNSGDKAVPFNLNQVVPGFKEMILMMRPGAEAHCIMPPAIAYGERGNQVIAPNETLVFDIKTVGVAQ